MLDRKLTQSIIKIEITELKKQLDSDFYSDNPTKEVLKNTRNLFNQITDFYDDLIIKQNKKILINKQEIEFTDIDLKNKKKNSSANLHFEVESLVSRIQHLKGENKKMEKIVDNCKKEKDNLYIEQIALLESFQERKKSQNRNTIHKIPKGGSKSKQNISSTPNSRESDDISIIKEIENYNSTFQKILEVEQKFRIQEAKKKIARKNKIKVEGGAFLTSLSFEVQEDVQKSTENLKKREIKKLRDDFLFSEKNYIKYRKMLFENKNTETQIRMHAISGLEDNKNKIQRQIRKTLSFLENTIHRDTKSIKFLQENVNLYKTEDYDKFHVILNKALENTIGELHESYDFFDKKLTALISYLEKLSTDKFDDEKKMATIRQKEHFNWFYDKFRALRKNSSQKEAPKKETKGLTKRSQSFIA